MALGVACAMEEVEKIEENEKFDENGKEHFFEKENGGKIFFDYDNLDTKSMDFEMSFSENGECDENYERNEMDR
jgi:hypothetical protein